MAGVSGSCDSVHPRAILSVSSNSPSSPVRRSRWSTAVPTMASMKVANGHSHNAVLPLRDCTLLDLMSLICTDVVFFSELLLDMSAVDSHCFLLLKTKFSKDPGGFHPMPGSLVTSFR